MDFAVRACPSAPGWNRSRIPRRPPRQPKSTPPSPPGRRRHPRPVAGPPWPSRPRLSHSAPRQAPPRSPWRPACGADRGSGCSRLPGRLYLPTPSAAARECALRSRTHRGARPVGSAEGEEDGGGAVEATPRHRGGQRPALGRLEGRAELPRAPGLEPSSPGGGRFTVFLLPVFLLRPPPFSPPAAPHFLAPGPHVSVSDSGSFLPFLARGFTHQQRGTVPGTHCLHLPPPLAGHPER